MRLRPVNRRAFLKGFAGAITVGLAVHSSIANIVTSSGPRLFGASGGGGGGSNYALPADRTTTWDPGLNSRGGRPSYTTVYASFTSTGDTTDRKAAIQTALDNCPSGQVVLLDTGGFYLSAYLTVKSGTVLRGTRTSSSVFSQLLKPVAGRPSTSGQGSSPYPAVVLSAAYTLNLDGSTIPFTASTALTADGAKGSFTVPVASTTGFAVGDLVRVDELSGAGWQTDPRGTDPSTGAYQIWASADFRATYQCTNPADGLGDFTGGVYPSWYAAYTVADRPICEMKKISSIDTVGSTITFTTPLHIDYRLANTAKVSKYNGTVLTAAGIENISAYGFNGGTFDMKLADGCWIHKCEADYWFDKPFNIEASFQFEVTGSVHHGTPYPSNSAENYGFIGNWGSADGKFEDCIGFGCNKVIAFRAAGAGCVIAGCYLDAGFIGYKPSDTWVEVMANASHFVGPHHVLFENNVVGNADSDFTHGNTIYVTHFRNEIRGFRAAYTDPLNGGETYNDWSGNGPTATSSTNGVMRCAGTNCFGYGHSFVGNVLGMAGRMSGWVLESTSIFTGKAVWMPGWAPTASRTAADPNVKSTSFWGGIIRDGNYDKLTNSQLWHGKGGTASSADTTPPSLYTFQNSYYSASKPAYMGANTWPIVDPTTGTVNALPAEQRWISGDFFTGVP